MNWKDYQASCAVCGGPADPDCSQGCESQRLNMAIGQAEGQWIEKWREQTREWVANQSIRYITNTFQTMKSARIANHMAFIQSLPHYRIYEAHAGRPPLDPRAIVELRRQIAEADQDLRRTIDLDWRKCVMRYPQVLAHYYSTIALPKEAPPPPGGLVPPVQLVGPAAQQKMAPPPIERARSTTGTAGGKKSRRKSMSTSVKGDTDMSLDALTKLLGGTKLANQASGDFGNGLAGLNGMGGFPGMNGLAGMNGSHANGMNGSHVNGMNGLGALGGMNGALGGFSGMGGLPGGGGMNGMPSSMPTGMQGFSGAGFDGLAALSSHIPGLTRTSSKAGRGSPTGLPPATRPSGKKRHSKDLMSNGRSTAPLPHAPYAPPSAAQPNWSRFA